MLIQTDNLSIGYRKNNNHSLVLSGINLKISSRKLIALVGTNGVGKSTLLKTLSGLLPLIDGNIFIEKRNSFSFSAVDWAKMCAVVLTDTSLNQNIKVRELIGLGRHPYTNWLGKISPEDEIQIDKALALTGIENLADRNINELSDGQRQKVFIARAIAQDTPLVLMDEPTTHLDFYNKVQFQKLVKKLSDTGKTIIYSTHDLDMAIQLSDELIVLTPTQVFHDSPNKLIDDKVFDRFFDADDIVFDQVNKRFLIK